MSNRAAPDGFRYGVMFQDGSVSDVWNGHTQRARAEEYLAELLHNEREWIKLQGPERLARTPDPGTRITLARRRFPDGQWERVVENAGP